MTAATTGAVASAASAAGEAGEFPRVLDGMLLQGPAARLAGLLDPAFLTEAGWDPVIRVLSLPARHRLLGRTLCRVPGCPATAHGTKTGGLCWRCWGRLSRAGMSAEQDRLGGPVAGAGGPPGRMRGSRLPADVAGWTIQAAERAGPRAFPPVAPHPGGADGAVPDRPEPGAVARVGPVRGGGLRPTGRKRSTLLPHPLRAVAHRGHRRPGDRPATLAVDLAGGDRSRAGQPARAGPAGGVGFQNPVTAVELRF